MDCVKPMTKEKSDHDNSLIHYCCHPVVFLKSVSEVKRLFRPSFSAMHFYLSSVNGRTLLLKTLSFALPCLLFVYQIDYLNLSLRRIHTKDMSNSHSTFTSYILRIHTGGSFIPRVTSMNPKHSDITTGL